MLQDNNKHLINGDDIQELNFYRFSSNFDNSGENYKFSNGGFC